MKRKLYWIGGIFVLVIVVVSVFYVVGVRETQKERLAAQEAEEKRIADVTNVAKQLVGTYLKSPGSAQFIDLAVGQNIAKKAEHYVAFGDVDSQNSFGGLMRSHFYLEFSHSGGSMEDIHNWKIEMLDLGGTNYVSDGKAQNPPLSLSDFSDETLNGMKEQENLYRQLWKK